jgi:aryl-alcohol dehydrogenase-like predicted oxidoreductase
MQKRKMGNTGLDVPVIMLGGNVFGWTVNESDSFRLLDAAFDAGLNFIDTADVYSRWIAGHVGGESETILGKWFARSGKRDRVIIATKVGMDMGDGKQGLAPKYIEQAVEASLTRLQTDRIDLYQSHKDDDKTRLEDTLAAFDKLVKQGKARFIGASNYSGARLRESADVSKRNNLMSYQTLQPHYNLVERENYETDLAPVVAEYGLGVIPYFSLAGGFLTGKYRSPADAKDKPRGGIVGKYLNDHGFKVIAALDEVAREHQSTPASVALAWLIAQPGITAPIASATSEKQLADLVKAAELKLDRAAIGKLSAASAPAAVASKAD